MPKVEPPLTLYVHIPWCARKCPYCDFNSHAIRGELDESGYVSALLSDLEQDLPATQDRILQSLFIGGGTPSLFSAAAIRKLLAGIRALVPCRSDMEITLEANPGRVEARQFEAFHDAGVNRFSLGVQSFHDPLLQRLERIHGRAEALDAVARLQGSGVRNFNIDLMFGLPGQTLAQARGDLEIAIAQDPSHISYYQLTLEPNTRFYAQPPSLLPDEDLVWEMQLLGQELLAQAGYIQYEVSAYAKPGWRCRHNLNYWRFGDYLGVGAGAHAKLTDRDHPNAVERFWKLKHPQAFLEKAGTPAAISGRRLLDQQDRVLEFVLNALRLYDGFTLSLFQTMTGLDVESLAPGLEQARQRGLLESELDRIRPTALGRRYLNDLINLFG